MLMQNTYHKPRGPATVSTASEYSRYCQTEINAKNDVTLRKTAYFIFTVMITDALFIRRAIVFVLLTKSGRHT